MSELPIWGTATVHRSEDTGELYWECVIDMEDGITESASIELAANTFKLGTVVKVYEPQGENK